MVRPVSVASFKCDRVWLVRRAEQRDSVLATKLTEGQRKVDPGVLRPEICALLARVEPLDRQPLVLDPFAGSGAIGRACAEAGARRVWLNDIDTQGARQTKASQTIMWTHRDFRDLEITPGTVSAVVTDPPWGHYSSVDEGVIGLYADLGAVARRWLHPGGAFVVLTGAPKDAVERLLDAGGFERELNLPVLVNGRKACVLVARKPRRQ